MCTTMSLRISWFSSTLLFSYIVLQNVFYSWKENIVFQVNMLHQVIVKVLKQLVGGPVCRAGVVRRGIASGHVAQRVEQLAGEAMILFHRRDDHLDVQIQRGPAVIICVGVKNPAYGREKHGFLFGQVIIQFCDEVVEVVTDAEHGKIVLSVDGAHRIQKRTYFWYGLADESMMMFENEVDQLFRSPVFK